MNYISKLVLSIVIIFAMTTFGEAGFPVRIGGAGSDYGKAVSVDSAGYVYVAGYFQGTTDFGGIVKTAIGSPESAAEVDIFLAKYSPMGELQWVRTISGSGPQMPNSLVVSGSNVYMIGYISGSTTFECSIDAPLEAGAGRNVFVCKYDIEGNFIWAFHLGDEETGTLSADDDRFEDGFDLALDIAGNIYITGTFNGTIDLDPSDGNDSSDTFVSNSNSRDIFVASYTSDAKYRWGFAIGGSGQDHGHAIRVSKDGSIFLAGFFSDIVDFEPGRNVNALSSGGGWDAFLAKYDANGKNLWAKKFGGTGNDQVRPGAMELREVDGKERLCLGGDFTGTTDFNLGAGFNGIQGSGAEDMFAACYDTDGGLIWVKSAPGSENSTAFVHRLSIDSYGNVYATGQMIGSLTFAVSGSPYLINNIGRSDVFVVKYDKNGNFIWAKTVGGIDSAADITEIGTGLATDIWDNVYATGRFFGTAGIGLQSTGNTDAFIMKYPSENTCLNVGSDLDIKIPCAQYHGKYYQFLLKFYPDPNILIWKIDLSTFLEIQAPTGSCMSVEDNLVFKAACTNYQGNAYQFIMDFYANPYDLKGLFWKMDITSLKLKTG